MFFQNISNQARKKLICYVVVKNYFSNVSQKFLIKIKSMRRPEIKEQAPKLALLYCARTLRSSYRRCIRKLFLNIMQYPQKIPLLESIFKKFADLQTCNFIEKSASLTLKQVPTCIRKPKTNTLSQLSSYNGCVLGCFQIVLGRFRSFQIVLDCYRLFQIALGHFSSFLILLSTSS